MKHTLVLPRREPRNYSLPTGWIIPARGTCRLRTPMCTASYTQRGSFSKETDRLFLIHWYPRILLGLFPTLCHFGSYFRCSLRDSQIPLYSPNVRIFPHFLHSLKIIFCWFEVTLDWFTELCSSARVMQLHRFYLFIYFFQSFVFTIREGDARDAAVSRSRRSCRSRRFRRSRRSRRSRRARLSVCVCARARGANSKKTFRWPFKPPPRRDPTHDRDCSSERERPAGRFRAGRHRCDVTDACGLRVPASRAHAPSRETNFALSERPMNSKKPSCMWHARPREALERLDCSRFRANTKSWQFAREFTSIDFTDPINEYKSAAYNRLTGQG